MLDINLQGELVFPVADGLVARGVPFVFATGYDAAVIPQRFSRMTRCEKPVDVSVIVNALFAGESDRLSDSRAA